MDEVQEIKNSLNIVDVVKDYVEIKKAGVNFRGLCPFHSEKTPSFYVSPTRQTWHCFGCNEGGDMYTFVEQAENISFPEALRILASKAGVQLKTRRKEFQTKKTSLYDILDDAQSYYRKILLEHPNAEKVREYIRERGVTDSTSESFGLGYAPPLWDAMLAYGNKRQYKLDQLQHVGLVTSNDKGKVYDKFRDRLMFPIRNEHGSCIGFGGRTMNDEDLAKYMNSPQSEVYDKSRALYGIDKARHAIKEKECAIIVEGYFDVILSHQAGVTNTVAVSGTALTEKHVRLLKRYTDTVALCFDADDAGMRATEKSFRTALAGGMDVHVISLPRGKDPADCVAEDPSIWTDAIAHSVKFLDFIYARVEDALQSGDITQAKSAIDYLFSFLTVVPNRLEQVHYIQKGAGAMGMSDTILWEEFQQMNVGGGDQYSETTQSRPKKNAAPRSPWDELQQSLVAYALARGVQQCVNLELEICEHLAEKYEKLYKSMLEFYNTNQLAAQDAQIDALEADLDSLQNAMHMRVENIIGVGDGELLQREYEALLARLRRAVLKKRLSGLQAEIARLEAAGDEKKLESRLADFQTISAQLNSL